MLDKRLDQTEVSRREQANAALLPPTATLDRLIDMAKPDWLLRRINAGRNRIPPPRSPLCLCGRQSRRKAQIPATAAVPVTWINALASSRPKPPQKQA